MADAVTDLLNKFGYGSIGTLIVVLSVQFIAKPIFDAVMEVVKEKKKSNLQSQLEIESKIKSSELEFDKYKKDIVLPVLQNIVNILEEDINTIQKYSNYITQDNKLKRKENKTTTDDFNILELEKNYEEIVAQREKNVSKLRDEILKISIFLPKEMRDILLVFRVSMETSLLTSEKLLYFINLEKKMDEQTSLIIGNYNIVIYRNLLNCFYRLIEGYIKIDYKEEDYSKILKKYGLNNIGEYEIKSNNSFERISAVEILAVTRRNKEEQNQLVNKINEFNQNR